MFFGECFCQSSSFLHQGKRPLPSSALLSAIRDRMKVRQHSSDRPNNEQGENGLQSARKKIVRKGNSLQPFFLPIFVIDFLSFGGSICTFRLASLFLVAQRPKRRFAWQSPLRETRIDNSSHSFFCMTFLLDTPLKPSNIISKTFYHPKSRNQGKSPSDTQDRGRGVI